MWVYIDFIGVHMKCSVLQHAIIPPTNYNITIKIEVKWEYLLTTTSGQNIKLLEKVAKNARLDPKIFIEDILYPGTV
jgi:hypothetical protein